ncbi:peroxiredoxin family protein [Thiohalobacter thiocyanaticus]|uniref:peroxiredoxin family protein n=1 Tax=Thiohalobacter thiocyanaticus TaxID=585455 RepID=UPI00294FF919|nr:hypothetical protein [Thiohalobacter thiocyanaticus]
MTRHRHLTRLGRAAWQVALVLLVLGAVHLYRTWDTASGQAPAFQARDLHGRPVALSDYAGQPMLVHFWAIGARCAGWRRTASMPWPATARS